MSTARYSSRYPRQGKFAILCEGDIAGYETDLLEKWFALQVPHLFVDVWPCGTKTAIFGMADSLGRAVPFFVIEDRDYRTLDKAQKDCQASFNDRKDRGTLVRSWRAWNRHEIENYLIEPNVAVPVLADWFGTSDGDVRARLEQVIATSAVDQAAQSALNILRSSLPEAQIAVGGLPRLDARPQWSKEKQAIIAPERGIVEERLTAVLKDSSKRFTEKALKVDLEFIINSFKGLADCWCKVQLADQTWLVDWAGKEVLLTLCRWLAGEFGRPVVGSQSRERVQWSEIPRQQANETEREITWALQHDLVNSFLNNLASAKDGDVRKEWEELINITM